MTIERAWRQGRIMRIIHRKFHLNDEQNGYCHEAAKEIMALLPADDDAIDTKAYLQSLKAYMLSLERRIDDLERINQAIAEEARRRHPKFFVPVPGSDKAV